MEVISVLEYTNTNKEADNFITKLPTQKLHQHIKDKIIAYLSNKNFVQFYSFGPAIINPFNQSIITLICSCCDNTRYFWDSELIYYVRDHDIALSPEFINYVLDFYEKGGTVDPIHVRELYIPTRSILQWTDTDRNADNFITKLPIKELDQDTKNKIFDYLNNSKFCCGYTRRVSFVNPFNEEILWNAGIKFEDGMYHWTDKFLFYLLNYNIALPQDFIEHVLKFYDKGGEVTPDYKWQEWFCKDKIIFA